MAKTLTVLVTAKKVENSRKGNIGTLIYYAYVDENFQGFPTRHNWVRGVIAKPETIHVGRLYDITLSQGHIVHFEPAKQLNYTFHSNV